MFMSGRQYRHIGQERGESYSEYEFGDQFKKISVS